QNKTYSMKNLLLFLLVSMTTFIWAQTPTEIRLYEGDAPGALGNEAKDIPTITAYFAAADKATGAAVLICPGGGYGHLAVDHEGKQIAEWYTSLGVHAFVLKYRLGNAGYRHPTML